MANEFKVKNGLAVAGSTSGKTILSAASAASGTITIPSVTGTLVTTGDTGSVTNTMLQNSSITINGTSTALGGSVSVALSALSGVSLSTLTTGQFLGYNGANWVNQTLQQTSSAGQGISYWIATPVINSVNTNNTFNVLTWATSPVLTGGTQTATAVVNNNTIEMFSAVTGVLGRTTLDAGQWTYDMYLGVSATNQGRSTTITLNQYQVIYSSVTFTTTGTGTSRTLTASASFFSTAVANATNTSADYVQTPQGLYQITAKASATSVTILVPSTYANESAVSGSLWHLLFGSTEGPVTDISPNYGLYVTQTTQPAFTINATDALGKIVYGNSGSNNNTTVTLAYNSSLYASNVLSPLSIPHNSIGGLQGGQSNQYYHLTASEYTGTGTGNFVRASSPSIAGLTLTGTLTAGGGVGTSGQYLQSTATGVQWASVTGGTSITQGDSSVAVSDSGTGTITTTVDGTVVQTSTVSGTALSGVPTAPTAAAATSTTQIATTAFAVREALNKAVAMAIALG